MTQPLPIIPGKTYLLTRRCLGRHRWLTPGTRLNALFLYLFALGAARFGLEVHGLVVMSTHYHAVVTDPLGVVPAFEQWLHSLLARAVNALRGRTDTFWDGRHGGRQEIADAAALRDALVYLWNNPTAAGLVRRGRDWPGVRTTPHAMLVSAGSKRPTTVERPEGFFDAAGSMPKTVELALSVPAMLLEDEARRGAVTAPASAHSSAAPTVAAGSSREPATVTAPGSPPALAPPPPSDAPPLGSQPSSAPEATARLKRLAGRVVARCNELIRQAEDRAAQRLADEGRAFVGARSLLRQSPNVVSTKPEEHGAKRTRIPLFLCSSREIHEQLARTLVDWRGRYRTARRALVAYLKALSSDDEPDAGFFEDEEPVRPPLFPWGTYQLRLRLAVPCHPPPD